MQRYTSSYEFSPTWDDDGDPDYVYYNASIVNGSTGEAPFGYDPQIRFNETRDIPILKDASKYNFSIVRFNLNGPNKDLPMFIPSILTGADNPTNNVNLTCYSVSLKATVNYFVGGVFQTNTFTATQNIIWSPETLDITQAPVPQPSTCQSGQDISTRYYWGYTYSHWLDLVAAAFAAAQANIQAQFAAWYAALPGAGPVPTMGTQPCQMLYNPTTNLFTLYADRYGFGGVNRSSVGSTADESYQLYFNSNMFGLFSNFQNLYVNLPGGLTNEIIIYSALFQNLLTVPSPPAATAATYWVISQDYPSTSSLWNPVESIVFTSSLLPLVNEQTGDPVRFGQTNLGNLSSNQAAFQPIITDVALVNESAADYRQFIQYSPQAEYRMASFQRSKVPLRSIDIQVYWKSRLDGQLYPVQMFNLSSVSFKMMLRRRGAFSFPHPAQKAEGGYAI